MSRRVGKRLRRRLIAQLVLLTVVLSAALAVISLTLIADAFESHTQDRLDRSVSGVNAALEGLEGELSNSLEQLDGTLREEAPGTLTTLFSGGAAAIDIAMSLRGVSRLDQLEIVDSGGRVVSASPWPEKAGLPSVLLADLAEQGPVLLRGDAPSAEGLVLTLKRPLRVGETSLWLIGGLALDQAFLESAASGDVAVLLDERGGVLQRSGRGVEVSIEVLAEWERSGHGRMVAGDAAGNSWLLDGHPLKGRQGRLEGRLLLAIDRGPEERMLGRITFTFIWVGTVAVLLAGLAGFWIAGKTVRPVDHLVRAVDAISTGRADYTFSRQFEDEFEELVSAFSRLHRSLELQQERSRASERVAAWRDIARRVAHEVKNPLSPIRLTVENLIRARQKSPQVFDELFETGSRTILEEVERLNQLVSEFSAFARLPAPVLRRVSPTPLIDAVAALYSSEPGLRTEIQAAGELPPITADPDQLNRALKNLVGNAVEAMRETGRPGVLEISTRLDNDRLHIEIADNGPGFEAGSERQVFEPYFTTKAGGTGLGLSIAYRIVTEHGGELTAENRPEGGALMTVSLPLSPPEADLKGMG